MSRSVLLFTGLLLCSTVQGAPRVELDYRLDLEAHQEREDEARSQLVLQLSDNSVARRLKLDYNLNGRYILDHVNDRDNSLWSGQGSLDYRFSHSLGAIANLSLAEVANPGVQIENELDNQTLLQGSAGLQWTLAAGGRGLFNASLLHNVFRYQSSQDLDADEDRFELGYRYRFSNRASASIRYRQFRQRYLEAAQSSLDTDNVQWQIDFDKRWARLQLQLFANTQRVDFADDSNDRFEGYGLELAHQINHRDRLSLRVSRDLQQAFRFNTLLGNGLDRLEQAGLVQTDRLRLGWTHRGRFTTAELSLYQDDLEIITGPSTGQGRQRGGGLLLRRELNEDLSAELSGTALDNEVDGNDTRLTELALIYRWLRSRNIEVDLRLEGRQGEEAGTDADDLSLILQGRARLF